MWDLEMKPLNIPLLTCHLQPVSLGIDVARSNRSQPHWPWWALSPGWMMTRWVFGQWLFWLFSGATEIFCLGTLYLVQNKESPFSCPILEYIYYIYEEGTHIIGSAKVFKNIFNILSIKFKNVHFCQYQNFYFFSSWKHLFVFCCVLI